MPSYRCYNLYIESDYTLPFQQEKGPVDVEIRRGTALSLEHFSPVTLGIWADETRMALQVDGIATYVIENEKKLSIFTERTLDDLAVITFLVSAAIPYLLVRRGYTVLRGATLTWDHQSAHGIVGASGSGKSSLVAKLIQEGATLLADQFLVFPHAEATVVPEYPSLKLWKNTLKVLHILESETQPVRPELAYFRWPSPRFLSKPLPLKTISVLHGANNRVDSLALHPVKGVKKMTHLIPYQWGNPLQSVWKIFPQLPLVKIIQTMPIFDLDYTRSVHTIAEVAAVYQRHHHG